jgi:hypothetical protein
MRIEENAGGGETVLLQRGDNLALVPASHLDLISPKIRDAFADPVRYFRDIAGRSKFSALSRWINALTAEPQWELELNRGGYEQPAWELELDCGDSDAECFNWTMVGFRWHSNSVTGALIGIPDERELSRYPATLARYYSLVDVVHWSIFGGAGGLEGAGDHDSIREFAHLFPNPACCPTDVSVLGSSGCGDRLIYSQDGRGGWLCHEHGLVHWLGSIADLIEWIFSELLSKRQPEYDYNP